VARVAKTRARADVPETGPRCADGHHEDADHDQDADSPARPPAVRLIFHDP
jgi:hypothetical protein